MARPFVQLKPKALSKFAKELEAACELTSQWAQPFGWSAYPLFDEKGTLRIGVDVCIPQCADCIWFSLLTYLSCPLLERCLSKPHQVSANGFLELFAKY